MPPVFNSVTTIELWTNNLLYFMNFMQINSTKDTTYFCIPKEFILFVCFFLLLVFRITAFIIKIVFTLILDLTFITVIICFNLKLYIFINVFIQNLANVFRNVLHIPFRILSIFIFYCFVFFGIILLIRIFHIYNLILGILSIYLISYSHVQLVLMLTKI